MLLLLCFITYSGDILVSLIIMKKKKDKMSAIMNKKKEKNSA